MLPLFLSARKKTKFSSWIIAIGKRVAWGVTPTHLGVQIPAGCRSHGSTRWQCRTRTWGGARTSSRNAASLPPRQGNGTRRRHTEEPEGSRRIALGSGPKMMKSWPSVLSKPVQSGRSHLFSLRWGFCAINEEHKGQPFPALFFWHCYHYHGQQGYALAFLKINTVFSSIEQQLCQGTGLIPHNLPFKWIKQPPPQSALGI